MASTRTSTHRTPPTGSDAEIAELDALRRQGVWRVFGREELPTRAPDWLPRWTNPEAPGQ